VNTDEYVLQEQEDGYDAIEWMARQPWCDGHINILGISYGGFTALQVASHNPPHLTSIIPIDFTDDRYTDECHYRGGLARKYYNVGYYGGFMIAWNAMPPLFPNSADPDWGKIWEQHLAHNEPYLLTWYQHQTDGPYWRHGSVRDIPEKITCPVFMIGGWRDGYVNSPLRLYELLNVPRKVLIGPWNHAMPDNAIPGPRIDYLYDVVRWGSPH
jgi:putative CocE/NonD family hydrolase